MSYLKLLGALSVFVLSDYVTTPVGPLHQPEIHVLICRFACQLPWLRLDALMVAVHIRVFAAIDSNILRYQQLNLVWTLPRFSQIATQDVHWAWILAAVFLPISFVRCASFFPSIFALRPLCREGMGGWRRLFGSLHSGVLVRRGVR